MFMRGGGTFAPMGRKPQAQQYNYQQRTPPSEKRQSEIENAYS
jgi:hypothetical protein